MNLARVVGTVVATQKYQGLESAKLLLIEPLDHDLRPTGPVHASVDVVRAGVGDLVYEVNSREAALAWDPTFVPVDSAIVGIVDDVNLPRLNQRDQARHAEVFVNRPARRKR